jgi:putative ABC transport system permease protein
VVGVLPGVTAVQYTGQHSSVNAYRSPYIPAVGTNALSVDASSTGLPAGVSTSMAQGRYLNAATDNEPVAVPGCQAAQLLGIDRLFLGEKIWVGGMWFYLVGILNGGWSPRLRSAPSPGFCPPVADRKHCGACSTTNHRVPRADDTAQGARPNIGVRAGVDGRS